MRVLLVLLFAAVAYCRVAPVLKVTPNIPGQYIVGIKPGVSVRDVARKIGVTKKLLEGVFQGVVVQANEELIEKIRNLDGISFIEEDGLATVLDNRDSTDFWGLDRIDQRGTTGDNAINIVGNGSGANVYIIDTGVRHSHEDFGTRAEPFFDYEAGGDGSDCNGHGTHCAGTAAGVTCGVASHANIYSVRVMSCSGSGAYSDIIAGLNAVAGDGKTKKVASMSIGGGKSTSLNNAVANAHNAGVVVVAAAGNNNRNACNYSPASATEAITVGATTVTDSRAYYSNYGSCLDIFAPGSSIKSASHTSDTGMTTMSGTSMACPHVAGASAVLLGNGVAHSSVASTLTSQATTNAVSDPGFLSPNRLLYLD